MKENKLRFKCFTQLAYEDTAKNDPGNGAYGDGNGEIRVHILLQSSGL